MRCTHVGSHHRYYGQTDNPSVRSGPEDASTHLHAVLPIHPITITNMLICAKMHVPLYQLTTDTDNNDAM